MKNKYFLLVTVNQSIYLYIYSTLIGFDVNGVNFYRQNTSSKELKKYIIKILKNKDVWNFFIFFFLQSMCEFCCIYIV